jgi:multidrug resistance protein MdtO
MALSYELVHLSDPHFNTGLTQIRYRVAGVFLGLFAMWAIFDRLWSHAASPLMTHMFDETLDLVAQLPVRGRFESAAMVTKLRNVINRNFDQVRNLSDAVLLEFRRERERDLTARRRVRSWQPLVRIIFMLRIALLRRGLIDEAGTDDPRVADAIATSSRVLEKIRGMETSTSPDPELVAATVAIPQAFANDPPAVRIAASLATVSAYLREHALLDLTSTDGMG